MNETIATITALMESKKTWLILCHENPDGDTIGCGLALYSLGKRLGKYVRIGGKDGIPQRYRFLPYSGAFEIIDRLDNIADDTLVICVDISTPERSVSGFESLNKTVDTVNIDHHGDNKRFCSVNLVDDMASATAEIVTDIIAAKWTITEEEGTCLYTALSTDNGNFVFSSTTPRSHRCAAVLLSAGVSPSYINDRFNQNMTDGDIRLWGIAMQRTEMLCNGTVALFWLNWDDYRSNNCDKGSTEGLVNMLLRILGVKAAIFISGTDKETCKISVRTREPFNAREIAVAFGGGGHERAAGAAYSGTVETCKKDVAEEILKYENRRISDN